VKCENIYPFNNGRILRVRAPSQNAIKQL
jgi:hypothetical protein